MVKILFSLAMVFLLSGYGVAGQAGDMTYQENQILSKGAEISEESGLFKLTVTDDGYFMGKGDGKIELVRGQGDAYTKGNYFVQVFAIDKIPAETRQDLSKSYDWINEKVIKKLARKKTQVILTKERDFQGNKALYVESFFSGKTSKGVANLTVIHSYAFEYVNLVFYHKDRLYWIYYSAPVGDPSLMLEPNMREGTRQKFEAFLAGVSLNP